MGVARRIGKYCTNPLLSQPGRRHDRQTIAVQNQSKTTHRFASQLQPAEDVERAGAAVRAEGVDALFGHCGDGVVAGLSRLPTGPTGVTHGKDQNALLGQGLFDGGRVAAVEGAPQGPDHRVAGLQQKFKDGFFERRLEAADYDAVGCATRLGPAKSLLLDGRRDDARGKEGDLSAVEQGGISGVIVIEGHKKTWVAALTYPTLRPSLPTTEISNTDSPRETCIMHIASQRPAGTIHASTRRPVTSLSAVQICEV